MNSKETQTAFRVLVSITTPKLADKAAELFILDNIPLQYECTAVGTAPNEMIDVLGLGNPDKVLLISYVPKDIADVMLKKLKKELKLGTINSGIAFTLPLKNATSLIVKMFENFAAYVLRDEEPIAPAQAGLAQVQLANAIQLSGWTGREVELPCDEESYNLYLEKKIKEETK